MQLLTLVKVAIVLSLSAGPMTGLAGELTQQPAGQGQRNGQASSGRQAAQADGPGRGMGELIEAVRRAQQQFEPVEAQDVERAERRLRAAMQRLDAFLAGNRQRQQGWKRYLRWQVLEQQLQEEEPDLAALNEILVRLYSDQQGLERRLFLELREQLRDYMNVVFFARVEDLEATYQQTLDQLAEQLGQYEAEPTEERADAIGELLGWLQRLGQNQQLVQQIRQRYLYPNIYAQISQGLAEEGFRDRVDQTVPVQDNILGTSVRGVAHTRGDVWVDFVPNAEIATFDIRMRGTALSDNVGVNGPVTIYSTGRSQIQSAIRLVIHPTGLYAGPAVANVSTDSQIQDICAHLRLIEHIAWRRAQQSQPVAEQIGSQRAEARVTSEMNEETAEMLRQVNENYHENFRNPLLRRDGFPDLLEFTTSDRDLLVRALQANQFQFGATGPPPRLTNNYAMSLRLHQSAVTNVSEATLAGRTLTDERLAELAEAIMGEVPEELRITPDQDPWSITFASDDPISAEFSGGNQLRVIIHGRQFTRGDDRLSYNMQISATYTMQQTPEGARLVRQEPPRIEFVPRRQLRIGEVALKTFMERKFAALFKPEFETTGLRLPGRWRRAGKLQLEQLEADQGWLTVAWSQARRGSSTPRTQSGE